jgi:hypothetical protein
VRPTGELSYWPWLYSQWRPRRLGYHTPALEALRALGQRRLRPELHAVPPAGAGAVGAYAALEARLSLRPVSYVVALAGTSSQAAGFEAQIRQGQRLLCSRRIRAENLTGGSGASPEGASSPLFLLPKPLAVIEPGLLTVQIVNLAAADNTVQLVLFVAAPEQ